MEEKKKETINLKEKAKQAWNWTKRKTREGFYSAKAFYHENKEFLMVIVPIGLGALKVASTAAKKRGEEREERDYKERSIWDAKSGQWFTTRKTMSSNQKIEFARRKSEGEDTFQILNDMRMI